MNKHIFLHQKVPLFQLEKSPVFHVENFTFYTIKRLVFMWKRSFLRLVGKVSPQASAHFSQHEYLKLVPKFIRRKSHEKWPFSWILPMKMAIFHGLFPSCATSLSQ
jgi:hypothetical protein